MRYSIYGPRYEPHDFREKNNKRHNVLYFTKWYRNNKSWLKIGITRTNNNTEYEATELRCKAESRNFDRNTTRYAIQGCVLTHDAKLHEKSLLRLFGNHIDFMFKDYNGNYRVEFFHNSEELDEKIDQYLYEHNLNINAEHYYL